MLPFWSQAIKPGYRGNKKKPSWVFLKCTLDAVHLCNAWENAREMQELVSDCVICRTRDKCHHPQDEPSYTFRSFLLLLHGLKSLHSARCHGAESELGFPIPGAVIQFSININVF